MRDKWLSNQELREIIRSIYQRPNEFHSDSFSLNHFKNILKFYDDMYHNAQTVDFFSPRYGSETIFEYYIRVFLLSYEITKHRMHPYHIAKSIRQGFKFCFGSW